MRNRLFAIAAMAGTLIVPVAAQAQSDTVGIVRGGTVVIDDSARASVSISGRRFVNTSCANRSRPTPFRIA